MEPSDPFEFERPHWHQRAACRDLHPNVMFPVDAAGVADARRICERCTVRPECAAQGLTEPHGVWGGQSERQRARLRRQAGIHVPPPVTPAPSDTPTTPPTSTSPPPATAAAWSATASARPTEKETA